MIRRKLLLVRAAVMPDLLHACGARDAIPSHIVDPVVAGLVFHVERSLGYGLLVYYAHGVLFTRPVPAEQFGINNRGLVILLVVAVIADRGQNVLNPSAR